MSHTAAFYKGNKQFSVEAMETTPPEAGEVQIDVAYCGICGTWMNALATTELSATKCPEPFNR